MCARSLIHAHAREARLWRSEIPAYAGMTWVGAGMTWEGAGMAGVRVGMTGV